MRLEDWRLSKRLTYDDLGEMLGCSRATAFRLCKKERGAPSPVDMQKIVEATGGDVRPNDFYDLTALADSDPSERGEAA